MCLVLKIMNGTTTSDAEYNILMGWFAPVFYFGW